MAFETGCCGYHFRENEPNLFGLTTLSVPLIVLNILALVIIYPLSLIAPALRHLRQTLALIVRINARLIHQASLFPNARCRIAGYALPYSPPVSGAIYRNFNLITLLLLWTAALLLIAIFLS